MIELLVVIAIISLLSSIVWVAVDSARSKTRDTRRVVDINQLRTALELYYDANKQYPLSTGATSPNSSWSNSNDSSWETLGNNMSAYMAKLPVDPKQSSSGWPGGGRFSYAYFSVAQSGCLNQQWYLIVYKLENASGPDIGVMSCDGLRLWQFGGSDANTAIKTVGVSR